MRQDCLGIGYLLPVNFGIDVRYNLGLTNTTKNSVQSTGGGTVKNGVIQIGVYFLFQKMSFWQPFALFEGYFVAIVMLFPCCFLAGLLLLDCSRQKGISKRTARKQQQPSNK